MTAAIATKSTRPRTKATAADIRISDDPTRDPEIRDALASDRKKITMEWRKYILDWLESPFHQDGDKPIHDIEMTVQADGVVIFLVNLDDEGGEQVRFMIDNGHGI